MLARGAADPTQRRAVERLLAAFTGGCSTGSAPPTGSSTSTSTSTPAASPGWTAATAGGRPGAGPRGQSGAAGPAHRGRPGALESARTSPARSAARSGSSPRSRPRHDQPRGAVPPRGGRGRDEPVGGADRAAGAGGPGRGRGDRPRRVPSRRTSGRSSARRRAGTSRSTRWSALAAGRAEPAARRGRPGRPGRPAALPARFAGGPATTPGWYAARTCCRASARGALPDETVALAREALLLYPHLAGWLARRAATRAAGRRRARRSAGCAAELGLRYDATGAYTALAGPAAAGGTGTPASGRFSPLGDRAATSMAVQEALRRHSLLDGVEPDLGRGHRVGAAVGADVAGVGGDRRRGGRPRRLAPGAGRPRTGRPGPGRRRREPPPGPWRTGCR